MGSWLLIVLSVAFSATAILLPLLLLNKHRRRLPPGPLVVPFIGNLLWLRRSISDIEIILRDLHAVYGPIITIHMGSSPTVFIADRRLAHKALVEHGAVVSDRPPSPLHAIGRFRSSTQYIISAAQYGPVWRLLRRNLISEVLHPNQVKLYAPGRRWVLGLLTDHLRSSDPPVVPIESFQYAMFSLLVLMCFGERLDKKATLDIKNAQQALIRYSSKLNVFALAPRLACYVFRKRLATAAELRRRVVELYVPLIQARRAHKRAPPQQAESRYVRSYLESLLDIQLSAEGGRGFTDDELVSLCSEFLDAGADTTSTGLHWIMASLVAHPEVQSKLAMEIDGVVGPEAREVEEEDLQNMPYLKAVVKEGLRRHPPGHFLLHHALTEDVEIGGYVVPKEATVNFMVAEMGWDSEAWEKPMEFRPERFLAGGEGEAVDVTGAKEIKMMPFGAGRRICPGLALAMLHLEYFVANLVREFEWKAVEGEKVDMTEKPGFTVAVAMKNPLRVSLLPRRKI